MEALNGDFEASLQTATKLAEENRNSSIMFDHARISTLLVEINNEMGRKEKAAAVAERFFREKPAWTDSFWSSNEHEPLLLGTLLEQRVISRTDWRTSIDVWEQHTRQSITKRQLWAFRWAPVSFAPDLALEGWSSAPDELPSAQLWAEQNFYRSLVGMLEGRMASMVGEHARAVELLESSTHSCHDLQIPFAATRAHLWLGQAKERLGDSAGACSFYATVLRRWGKAKPSSVTADEARRRARELRCGM